jgi:hypothetical protein
MGALRLRVCLRENKACGGYSSTVINANEGLNRINAEFEIRETELCIEDLHTPMSYEEFIGNARAVPTALGETRGKSFFLGKAVVFVGPKLFLTNFENMKRTYPRIFGSIKAPSVNLYIRFRRYLLLTLIVLFLRKLFIRTVYLNHGFGL